MKLLNRSAFSLLPKQPFVDWVAQLEADADGLNQALSLEEHRREGTTYLIDEVSSEEDLNNALQQQWRQMFDNELAAWDEIGDHWPHELTFELFQQWFELKPQVMVIDLSPEPLLMASLDV